VNKARQAYEIEQTLRCELEKRIPRAAVFDVMQRGAVSGNHGRAWIDLAPQDAADIGFKRIELQMTYER
jgi:hypothetical protein